MIKKITLSSGLRFMTCSNDTLSEILKKTEGLVDCASHPLHADIKSTAKRTALLAINLCITAMNLTDDDQEKKKEIAKLLYEAGDLMA